jgi:hypothetical protein
MASISWYACITYNTYLSINDIFGRRGASLRIRYHFAVWGISLITTVIVMAWPGGTQWGQSGTYHWIIAKMNTMTMLMDGLMVDR